MRHRLQPVIGGALLIPLSLIAHPCQSCHPKEVAAYSRSAMARSWRPAVNEPAGAFTDPASGTAFKIDSGPKGVWHRMQRADEVTEHAVAWAIGSGSHATGYLIDIGGHLFQSPLCFYANRGSYGLAPGYEHLPNPDFSRPVGEECLLCHAGRALPTAAGISCERCHGDATQHLRRPVSGSIVNPRKLDRAARDSICEQCHLTGVARILNPGRTFADFRPGQRLEEVFTVYTHADREFKVISHAEQLARSACARNSGGKLWCGTCHDPHPAAPAGLATYDSRCQTCHQGRLPQSHTADNKCVSCHMTRREAQDGGHTVFTHHRITKRPEPEHAGPQSEDLAAWREPDPALSARNLALAYVTAGISSRSPAQIVRGYRALTEVQKTSPNDIEVLKAIGRALLLGKEPREALIAFERVLQLAPESAESEENVGVAALEADQVDNAVAHLERALELDPLLLPAASALEIAYHRQGETEKAAAIAEHMRRAMSQSKIDRPAREHEIPRR